MTILHKFFLFAFFSGLLLTVASCHKEAGHNRYLEGKTRVSERQMREDKKVIAKGNRAYKKQMRRNRKHLFGRATAPKS